MLALHWKLTLPTLNSTKFWCNLHFISFRLIKNLHAIQWMNIYVLWSLHQFWVPSTISNSSRHCCNYTKTLQVSITKLHATSLTGQSIATTMTTTYNTSHVNQIDLVIFTGLLQLEMRHRSNWSITHLKTYNMRSTYYTQLKQH